MTEFLLIAFGFLLAAFVFSQSDTLTFVSKDFHVKYKGYIYKMTKVSEADK